MTQAIFNLTANTTGSGLEFATSDGLRKTYYQMTIVTSGSFGGGTVAYFLSPDNGTTLIPLKVPAGTPYTVTANDYLNFQNFGNSGTAIQTQQLSFWATLTGATAPNINIAIFDNV